MHSPTPRRAKRLTLAALCLALLGTACTPPGSSTQTPAGSGAASCAAAPTPPANPAGWGAPAQAPKLVPVLIAAAGQLVCGPNRVLFTVLDEAGRPVGAPDRSVSLAIYELGKDPGTPIATVDGSFVWAIENERGIYIANVAFPESGRYGAEFTTAKGSEAPEKIRLTFDVQPSSAIVKVGDRAPASKTPTLADVGGDVSQISTDPHPEPAFYETSVDQALASHEPFVLVFATPKFCTSAQCGPTLDKIKPYLARYPGVTFINVEPYKLKLVDGILEADLNAEGKLQTAPVTDEWKLFNEPALFVVDREGIVQGAFELIFGDAELTAALDKVK